MFGSPLKEATWNTAEGAIYNGATVLAEGTEAPLWYTTSEGIWLLISVGLCVFALLYGHGHEAVSYRRARDQARGAGRDY